MKTGRLSLVPLLGCLLLGLISREAVALEFKAEVDRETLALDDSLVLTLTISGQMGQVPGLDLGELQDFEARDAGHQQRMSVVNGQMSLLSIQQFELRPRKAGELKIPALSIVAEGSTYTTQPITINVTQAPAVPPSANLQGNGEVVPQPENEVELQASATPEKVYVGQQLSYRLRVYRRIQWDNPGLDPVKFDGFWVEELGTAGSEKRANFHGQTYAWQDLVYALFPSTPGPHQLEARTLRYSRITEADRFFAIPRPAPPVLSNPVDIEVLPWPEAGRPAKFSGAVGTLEISAKLDRNQSRQDQAVTLTVVVSGVGNPNTFPQPELNLPAEIEVFETQTDVYVNKKRDLLTGSRTFKTVLVPRGAGELKLGPFQLSTFDPYKGQYVEVQSEPITLSVEKGKESVASSPSTPANKQADLQLLGEDIRYLKPMNPLQIASYKPLLIRPGFVFLATLPLLGLAGLHFLKRHRQRLTSDTAFRRRRQAQRTAQERLATAGKTADPAAKQRLLEQSIVGFLSDWFNLSGSTPASGQLEEHLQRAAISEPLKASLRKFLDECARFRFAHAGANPGIGNEFSQQAQTLLADLQRELGAR